MSSIPKISSSRSNAVPSQTKPRRSLSRPTAQESFSPGMTSNSAPVSDDEYVFLPINGPPRKSSLEERRHEARPSTSGDSTFNSEQTNSVNSHEALLSPLQRPNVPYRATAPEIPTRKDDPLPPTLNTLEPAERAALIRQSRKLNKLLGETPHIAEIHAATAGRNIASRWQRRGTVAAIDVGSLKRSATLAAIPSPKYAPQAGNWSRPGATFVSTDPFPGSDNLQNAPLLRLTTRTSSDIPNSPIRQRRASDSSVASAATGTSFTFPRSDASINSQSSANKQLPDSKSTLQKSTTNATKDTGLNPSVYFPQTPTSPQPTTSSHIVRQQTRARMAKLQQITGESVPSELVIARRPSSDGPASNLGRRLSMDLPPVAATEATKSLKHKRSRSLWRKDFLDFDSAPEDGGSPPRAKTQKDRYESEYPGLEALLAAQFPAPLTDKQKAINVKRALKMAAVFGVPPPPTHSALQSAPKDPQPSKTLTSRQSIASLASLAYMLDHDRDSLYDLLASADDSSDDEDQDENPIDWPYEHRAGSDTQDLKRNSKLGKMRTTSAGKLNQATPATPPFVNLATSPPSSYPSSSKVPPHSVVISVESTRVSRDDGPSKIRKEPPPSPAGKQEFAVRRRRATKLSRFFGVGYQELFNTMLYGDDSGPTAPGPAPVPDSVAVPPNTPQPAQLSRGKSSASHSRANSGSAGTRRTGGTVSVQTDAGKSTVLRTSTHSAADIDAEDLNKMLARLRALKA